MNIAIIGAGIAGLSAAYKLQQNGYSVKIYEQRSTYGGLLDKIEHNGFRFDRAIHLSFADQPEVREIFDQTPYFKHNPESKNFDREFWLRHPVQNNLEPLPVEEKVDIIKGFVNRPDIALNNYRDWLYYQYGESFSLRYPVKYTRKYWTVPPEELGVDWIGNRMYRPSLDEILRGAFTRDTDNVYYAKEMRYPKSGGYKSFLDPLVENANISYGLELTEIDLVNKVLLFTNGHTEEFDYIINTIPLPKLAETVKSAPTSVLAAAKNLWSTKVDLVSIGFNKPDIPKDLWFYIYDEDILASRVYSPSIKSPDNAPEGKSSVQFEIYSSVEGPLAQSIEELKDNCVYALQKMKIANDDDIEFVKHDVIDFGNVVFYKGMEGDREIVREWAKRENIFLAGRFGCWEYYWSHQAMKSGFDAADNLIFKMK